MPWSLHEVISVLNPLEGHKSSVNIGKNRDGSLHYSMQDIISSMESGTQLPAPQNQPSSQKSFLPPIRQENISVRDQQTSSHKQEFNKLCKSEAYLPDPLSKTIHEMSMLSMSEPLFQFRRSNHSKVRSLDNFRSAACLKSPKSYEVLNSRVHSHKSKDRTLFSGVLLPSLPLSTVSVYRNKTITPETMTEYLKSFGEIDRLTKLGERTYRVVYRDLISACLAVQHSKKESIRCRLLNKNLHKQRFIQEKGEALKITTDRLS